jgi:hypothetical protein
MLRFRKKNLHGFPAKMKQQTTNDKRLAPKFQNDHKKTDLIVVGMANLINIMMAVLFAARISGLPRVENALGVAVMAMGFALGYIAFLNRRRKRDKWLTYLLIPIFLFLIVELILDYILAFDFRSTIIVGPYILLYYVGLWGLIGYGFKFDKKWGVYDVGNLLSEYDLLDTTIHLSVHIKT